VDGQSKVLLGFKQASDGRPYAPASASAVDGPGNHLWVQLRVALAALALARFRAPSSPQMGY
jgi:hypothetical protein